MAIKHWKVNISSASGSYDYTAYLCTVGSWSLVSKTRAETLSGYFVVDLEVLAPVVNATEDSLRAEITFQ